MCNFKCEHCASDIDNTKVSHDSSTEQIVSTIEEMAKEGSLRVGFTGGEPTLRRDLDKLVKAGKDNNLLITLTTNGWFVQKKLDTLKKLDLMVVSLDSTRDVHDDKEKNQVVMIK